ncbi:MAG TPA: hypothetical protein VH206_14260 [Xanthobacteraceae bacterium]|jgi:hypothetical protein|nr:hypothetical protein [Xanthobacteraceae bacterium]
MPTDDHIQIAHLEEKRFNHTAPALGLIGILIGLFSMVVLIAFETSAIRLAADGAIWTGWNVLCGIAMLNHGPVYHYVYRMKSPPSG